VADEDEDEQDNLNSRDWVASDFGRRLEFLGGSNGKYASEGSRRKGFFPSENVILKTQWTDKDRRC
jgi:hypothetical protein